MWRQGAAKDIVILKLKSVTSIPRGHFTFYQQPPKNNLVFFFDFFFCFLMRTIFKVFTEFVTISLLFHILGFGL